MNRFEEALQYYDIAISKGPENADYFYNKGNTLDLQNLFLNLDKMNRFEEALEFYDLAINKNPENADYYQNKANTLFLITVIFKTTQNEQI